MRPVVLCFSGLDPSGGAGLQADIEAVGALGGHAAVVCTALTIQDSQRVYDFQPIAPEWLQRQARCILDDLPVAAVKMGMLASAELVTALFDVLADYPQLPIVLDPVLSANSGGNLAQDSLLSALKAVAPRCTMWTPNGVEARRLTNQEALPDATDALLTWGMPSLLVKGGHEPGHTLINDLYHDGQRIYRSEQVRLPGDFHGSGCTLAAAIACGLAQQRPLIEAVERAERFTYRALTRADRPRPDGQLLPWRVDPVEPI